MFRSKVILGLMLTMGLCGSWMWYLACKQKAPSTNPIVMRPSSSAQSREKVRKDIWLSNASTGRLHHRIESDRSLITLHPHGSSIEVLEHLFGVRCWIEEKNGLRFVLAEEGTYRYDNQSFEAQDVLLSFYRVPRGILPAHLESYTPFLRGHADAITFSLHKGTPCFEACQFQAFLGENSR